MGFRAWAPSLEGLFQEAARAMLSLAMRLDSVQPREERRLQVEGIDREELLVSWLQEVLHLWQAQRFPTSEHRVRILRTPEEEWHLEGRVLGEPWDPERHEVYTEIKAVTYHELQIREEADPAGGGIRYEVDVILDI
jgi:SHS2 domain-containing protein